jgi:hypothetical protein
LFFAISFESGVNLQAATAVTPVAEVAAATSQIVVA